MKPYFKFIPEAYFTLSVLYYWAMAGTFLNPFAIALLAAIVLLLIFKNKTLGLLLSILSILVNLFLFAALMSEYREFHEPTAASRDLILYGSIYLGLNLLISIIMLAKYALMESPAKPVRQGAV
jgi:hypothetical protein